MSHFQVLLLAFLIGAVCGLRSLTGPATVAWGAHLHWLSISNSIVAFIGSKIALVIFTLLALVELVLDKLPSTPSRLSAFPLTARIITGALCGACVAYSGGQSLLLGAIVGIAGAVAGAYAGNKIRARLVNALKVPDFVIAILEDATAIAAGFFIVSRF